MKKIYLLLAFVVCPILCTFAQDYEVENGDVVIKKVIETPLSIEKAHDAVETYFAGTYGDSNHTNKLNTPDHIIYIGEYVDLYRFTMGMWTSDARHNIDIAFKEGRVRVKISCSTILCRGLSANAQQGLSYTITSAAPFTSSGATSAGANKKTTIAIFDALTKRMQATMLGVEEVLTKDSTSDDDW